MTKKERQEMNEFRIREGLRPLAEPREIECMVCLQPFLSPDPRAIHKCPYCQEHGETPEFLDPSDLGGYLPPKSRKVPKARIDNVIFPSDSYWGEGLKAEREVVNGEE